MQAVQRHTEGLIGECPFNVSVDTVQQRIRAVKPATCVDGRVYNPAIKVFECRTAGMPLHLHVTNRMECKPGFVGFLAIAFQDVRLESIDPVLALQSMTYYLARRRDYW